MAIAINRYLLVDPDLYTPGCAATGRHVMVGLVVRIIVNGLIAGTIARPIASGKQAISIPITIVPGIVGAFAKRRSDRR